MCVNVEIHLRSVKDLGNRQFCSWCKSVGSHSYVHIDRNFAALVISSSCPHRMRGIGAMAENDFNSMSATEGTGRGGGKEQECYEGRC